MLIRRLLIAASLGRWLRRATLPALGLAGLLGAGPAFGQADSLRSPAQRLARYARRTPTEKLFLHLDRPCYVSGETLWFKIYAVEGTDHRPLPASQVAYVEVLDGAQQPVLQAAIGLRHATGHGALVLPAALASGRYTVRAYTSWMRNFDPGLYFQTSIAVVNTNVPAGAPPARPAVAYDPQFFPEGGYLVRGLSSRVGFKITDGTGRGVAAEGTVQDAAGAVVARFQTRRFGLGSFAFTPARAGAAYTAVITANGQTLTCPLPPAREQGYVLRLEEASPAQLRVVVQASGAALADEDLFLLGHTGQHIGVAAGARLRDGQASFVVDKQRLADGVSHFTLFDGHRQPVCERLYFRPPAAPLALTARADQPQYGPRQKVTLQLAAGPAGAPLPASLSVAVEQLDSLSAAGGPDVASYLWLTADLRGPVERPDYYLAAGPEAAAAADDLMLTQGWSRFRWPAVLADGPDSLAYLPELRGQLVRGRVVSRATGAPAAGVAAYLSAPSRRIQLYNSISKADGSVQFEAGDLHGPQQLVAQAGTRRDSLYQVEIFSPFSQQYAAPRPGPPGLPEALAPALLRRHVQAEVQRQFFRGPPAAYRLPRLDSLAFYGKPDEHYRLDDYTRFKVLEEVMREYVPGVLVRIRKDGFHFLVANDDGRGVLDDPLVLLDGLPIFNTNRIMAFDPLKIQQLDVITKRYVLGPQVFNGIVSYTTYKGDLAGFPLDAHALLQEYEGLQGEREFYAPRYETPQQRQSRLPDFRNLLYWNPEISPGAGPAPTFYTSDQVGRYRVVVQGVAANGQAGSAGFTFEVKPAL
ncbi:hypothetical protein ACFQ48_05610 [Hymenobacter caeli]|uniref:Macroglobulin domain-containing protein n=1 Tax=Hymenobacter caeli TaxID=2735894 RepID=A0ABX2FNB7_9BACT|nr:hypothetical protein [Hymenobacter caeli]NRT18644.1 hypothetical protein [Hymenobacter caeli]